MVDPQVKDSVEQRASSTCHIKIGERRSDDMNFKLRLICEAKQANNRQAVKKFDVSECNV